MRITGKFIFHVAALALIMSSTMHAATLADFNVTETAGRSVQSAFVSNDKVSVLKPNDPSGIELLYDSGRDSLFIIEHAKRSYSELDRQTVDGLAGQAAGVRDAITGNTTPEQQQQLASMLESVGLQGFATPENKVATRMVKTSENRNVGGFDCNVVRLYRNEQLNTVMCVASRSTLRMSERDYLALRSMLAYANYLAGHAEDILGNIGATLPNVDIDKFDGLPIAVTDLDDGVTVVLTRLVQAQDRPGGPGLPAGYRETALPSIW